MHKENRCELRVAGYAPSGGSLESFWMVREVMNGRCNLPIGFTAFTKCNLQPATRVALHDWKNLQPTSILGMINSVSCSRKQALALGKKPNARFAVLQTAIRGCASAMLKTMQILALHSAFTRIQGTKDSGIGKNDQSCVFCSNFAPWFRSTRSWAFFRS